MYRLGSIRVVPYNELKKNISPTLLSVFLDSYNTELCQDLEAKLGREEKLHLKNIV
jgi:hypothetical protein